MTKEKQIIMKWCPLMNYKGQFVQCCGKHCVAYKNGKCKHYNNSVTYKENAIHEKA